MCSTQYFVDNSLWFLISLKGPQDSFGAGASWDFNLCRKAPKWSKFVNFSSFEPKAIHAKCASFSKSLHSNFAEVGALTFQGAPTYDFAKSSQKLHGIDRIWTWGEGGASKILLYRSAIDVYWCHIHILVFHDMMNILYELCSKMYYKFR